MVPQVNFEQTFIDRAAELFHQQKRGTTLGLESDPGSEAAEEGEAEMSEGLEASKSGLS